ncbi:MAG TPA: hypothetical protein VKR23_01765 [Gaiellaceae bacterium]|nr:hypothetical protein [Gaiellaceae bacterium]
MKLGQARERVDRLPRGENQRDPLGEEAARHEREYSLRGAIERLRVVDNAKQRLLLCRLREQAEDSQPDEEWIRSPARASAERNLEGFALRRRQAVDQVQAWRANLLKRRKWEFHLAFDAGRTGDTEVRCCFDGVVEQGRFADARLSVHQQHAALAVPRPGQYAVENVALSLPADQTRHGCPHDHPGEHACLVTD